MEKNIALEELVDITNRNLGYVPSTPAEFNLLSHLIQKKTGRFLSVSSIKRIWGYVRYDGFPSVTTLNTLAIYNEFSDWRSFMVNKIGRSSECDSGYLEESVIRIETLYPGDRVSMSWNSGKGCEIECLGDGRFKVTESRNIKLEEGDTFTLHTLCVGHPIYVSNIERGDIRIPGYIGARKGGISTLTLIPAEDTLSE